MLRVLKRKINPFIVHLDETMSEIFLNLKRFTPQSFVNSMQISLLYGRLEYLWQGCRITIPSNGRGWLEACNGRKIENLMT